MIVWVKVLGWLREPCFPANELAYDITIERFAANHDPFAVGQIEPGLSKPSIRLFPSKPVVQMTEIVVFGIVDWPVASHNFRIDDEWLPAAFKVMFVSTDGFVIAENTRQLNESPRPSPSVGDILRALF